MKRTNSRRSTIFFILTVAAAILFAPIPSHTQEMQRGVSVQMAVTSNATSMPDADQNDAWVVAVTANGNLYLGADAMTPEGLTDWIKTHPRNRAAKLYIKADTRAAFASVEQVLEAGRGAFFPTPVLLTSQREPRAMGTVVPPNGLEVLIGPALPAGTVATVVQLLNSGQPRPLLRVNGDEISWSALEGTLRRHFQKGDEKVILLKADERLPFGPVVQVIDVCRSTGAKVFLPTPEL
ncbi:MAG TPA: biopolymer transporter ExbD [Candidatus Sulfotelmatobacter sp.]